MKFTFKDILIECMKQFPLALVLGFIIWLGTALTLLAL